MAAFSGILAGNVLRGAATQAINTLTTLAGVGTVNIIDVGTFTPIFYGAEPMRVNVRESSRVMSHPVESGVTISDHHVIEPKAIEVSLLIPASYYVSVYQRIKTAFDTARLLILQCNADVYTNLIIAEMPHEESPDLFNTLVMALRFQEVLFIPPSAVTQLNTQNPTTVPSNYAPANPADSNTVLRGPSKVTDKGVQLPAKVKKLTTERFKLDGRFSIGGPYL